MQIMYAVLASRRVWKANDSSFFFYRIFESQEEIDRIQIGYMQDMRLRTSDTWLLECSIPSTASLKKCTRNLMTVPAH